METTALEHETDVRGRSIPFEASDSRILRRVTAGVMAAAVVMILVALVSISLYFKGVAADAAKGRAAVAAALAEANAKLTEATRAIDLLNELVKDTEGSRARALAAAVKQVTDAQQKVITDLFAKERAISKAEHNRQIAALRAAQADLERKIAGILSGPPGPSGPAGPPGACKLVCL